MDVLAYRDSDFHKSLAAMRAAGGVAARAAGEAYAIIFRLRHEEYASPDTFGDITNHGESRIRHCVKYDLPGHYRLVTVWHEDKVWLLFAGSHDQCDRWIEQNRGTNFTVNRKSKRIEPIQEVLPEAPLPGNPDRYRTVVDAETPLLNKLAKSEIPQLGLSESQLQVVKTVTAVSSDDELVDAVEPIPEPKKSLVLNVLIALRDSKYGSASALISKHVGEAQLVEENAQLLKEALSSPENSDSIINLRDLSDVEVEHLFNHSNFQDWMLFLHPDQKAMTTSTYAGPVLLRGVSGSGKTCVLVHRARHLAEKYPGERIAIITLNPALAEMIKDLLDGLCPPETREKLHTHSIGGLYSSLIKHFAPEHPLLKVDPRSSETLEDCFWESYQKEEQQQTLEPIIRSLEKTYNTDPARYIRDEFIWIRSAFHDDSSSASSSRIASRKSYLDPDAAPRRGRAIPFNKDWRDRMLKALRFYEEYLTVGGFCDHAGLSLLAHRFVDRIASEPHPFKYRCLLADEYQDLGTVELDILRALTSPGENGLFLAGDAKQQVFPKEHDLRTAGIDVVHRKYFRKNYRNTKQILEAGVALIEAFGTNLKDADDDPGVLNPELSIRESAKPLVVSASSEDDEVSHITEYVKLKTKNDDLPVCIVACGIREDHEEALKELEDKFRTRGLNVSLLSKDSKVRPKGIYLSGLETVKGFEFSLVVVAQCGAAEMPSPYLPTDESWRDARRLYVALTRARDEVLFTHSDEASRFLTGIGSHVLRRTVEEEGLIKTVSNAPDRDIPSGFLPPVPRRTPRETFRPEPKYVSDKPAQVVQKPDVAHPPSSTQRPSITNYVWLTAELIKRGLNVIDMRSRGGALWVVGGPNLEKTLSEFHKHGFHFLFARNGSRTTKRQPAWYVK